MDYVLGTVRNVTFFNEENHYCVVKIDVIETSVQEGLFDASFGGVVTVVGHFVKPIKGERYRFYGETAVHPVHGKQFQAKTAESVGETTESGLIDYLSSDLFKGVGEKTAERIVKHLGTDAIAKILEDKSVLDDVEKIQSGVKDTLYNGLVEHKAIEKTLIELYGYGISSKIAMRIIDHYKDQALRRLKENPYKLIDDVEGIGFERADAIASSLGFAPDHPERIKAMLVALFKFYALEQGHTTLPVEGFLKRAHTRLNKNAELVDEETLQSHFDTLLSHGKFMIEDGMLTLKRIVDAEQEVVAKIRSLQASPLKIDEKRANALIDDFEKHEKIHYTQKQRVTVLSALKHRTMILTGGPGTGKTTVIKGLVNVFYKYHNLKEPKPNEASNIHLVAPTGRAAKRMQESTGYHALTIHRFLGYGFDGMFVHDKHHQVEGNLFIIDESSMIDIYLAAQLLESLPDYANVVFVGDDAQLPSVGPGQVFKDLITSQTVPVVILDVIHRQAENSNIIKLAQAVRSGNLPNDLKHNYQDRYVLDTSPEDYTARLKRIIDYWLSQGYSIQEDIQVLIPMYKGDVGIDATNAFLQKTYNTNASDALTHGERTFKKGDKVLQLTNQIEDGVMNGDQGVVSFVDTEKHEILVDFVDARVAYKGKDLINLRHAYAVSIHKSQGSEYPVVIMPIFKSHSHMLKRKLLYTGITRAKSHLVVFGHINRLTYAVRSLEESRMTHLKNRLASLPHQTQETSSEVEPKSTVKKIEDPLSAFDSLGEPLDKSPFDFLD